MKMNWRRGRNRLIAMTVILAWASAGLAQDTVRYRAQVGRADRPIQEARGKIENESIAGIKIGGAVIPAGDIVDVTYETPGGLRIDLREAQQAEDARKFDEAVRKYRVLASSPAATNNKSLKRYFDFKAAWIAAHRGDAPADVSAGIMALSAFIADHPDGWERIPVTRLLARLQLDTDPPNYEAARKTYETLGTAPGTSPAIKAECKFAVVDLQLAQKHFDLAKKALEAAPSADPRVAPYRIACAADPAHPAEAIKSLEDLLAKADDNTKATIYNLLGDCYRLDSKKDKDALFSYLWVDLVYNSDPVENAKAEDHIAELFKKMNQDDRAKMYRDKARGR